MRLNNSKIITLLLTAFSTINSYAIDPDGARVDYDNDSNSDGGVLIFVGLFIGLCVIGFIIWFAYQYFSSASERNANIAKKPKPKPYSKEWFDIQHQKAEKEDEEGKAAMWGFAIGFIFIGLPALLQQCS